MKRLSLRGAVVVVTGASSGIGAATAVAMAGRGAKVLAVGRREERLRETVDACRRAGGEATALRADVTSPDSPSLIADAAERLGDPDVVVHNAGIGLHRPITSTDADEVEALFEVHVLAPVRITATLLPGMLERRRGAIVTITSISAFVPAPGEAAYGAAKAALARWTHGLAVELAGTGVRACSVSPGPIATEIWEHVGRHYPGRLFPPETVAAAVVRAAERGGVQRHAPRRFAIAATAYPLAGGAVRAGVRVYSRLTGGA